MSYKALNYTKTMKLFRQKAKSLTSALPKGTKLAAGRMLHTFLEEEKEILRKWYSGMLLKVLDEEDFSLLLASKKKALHFLKLAKTGLDKKAIRILREEVFLLLRTILTDSAGAGLHTEVKYKVRLYRLPEQEVYAQEWDSWEQDKNQQLLN